MDRGPASVAALSRGAWAAGPRVAAGAHCQPMAVTFLCVLRSKAEATSHSSLGQNSFRHRFLSNVWWVRRNHESFYKLSFAFQSLLNQHHSKPTGCHASQSCRWQICHVMSDLRENGKGETLPRTAAVAERVVHWSGSQDFCIPSDFYQSKPHVSILWAEAVILHWSHLTNWTWLFLGDLASSV